MGGPDEGQLIYENGIDRNVPRGSKKQRVEKERRRGSRRRELQDRV